jgi:hypothetical protein
MRVLLGCATVCLAALAHAQPADMTFFLTSAGSEKGADFGGLAGADRHCQALATAAGAGARTWRAYQSWNSSHDTIGCSDDALRKTGGAGLIYCFAAR